MKKKILLINFKSDFWKGLLKEFNKANPDCFKVGLNLRETFFY